VTDRAVDPRHFFDEFPRFVETSETGPWLDRLNARHVALVHEHRELIRGARVLDLASHDGRFSFAALRSGAARVVGIEHDPRLVQIAAENMAFYAVPDDRYEFVAGDMFECIRAAERCDVVFCFGIFYHINDHMRLLTELAEFDPRAVIFDTNVALETRAVIELRAPVAGSPPPAGSQLEGWPSRAALEAMWSSFGWTFAYFDWVGSGMADHPKLNDYAAGRRLTAVVMSDYRDFSPEVRADAVREVFEGQRDLKTQWFTITGVASKYGMTPQALHTWVRQAERETRRGGEPPADLAPDAGHAVD
jgi:transposase-like protein